MASKTREGSNNVVLSESVISDPIGLFQEGINYYDYLMIANEELFLNSDFELIDGFTTFNRPDSDQLLEVLLYSALIGIGVAYV